MSVTFMDLAGQVQMKLSALRIVFYKSLLRIAHRQHRAQSHGAYSMTLLRHFVPEPITFLAVLITEIQ